MKRILTALGLAGPIDAIRGKLERLGRTIDDITDGLADEFGLDTDPFVESDPPAVPEPSANGTHRRRTRTRN